MSEIPTNRQRAVLEDKVRLWENSQFASECDIKLAKTLGDERMLEAATADTRRCIQAVEILKKMLAALPAEAS